MSSESKTPGKRKRRRKRPAEKSAGLPAKSLSPDAITNPESAFENQSETASASSKPKQDDLFDLSNGVAGQNETPDYRKKRQQTSAKSEWPDNVGETQAAKFKKRHKSFLKRHGTDEVLAARSLDSVGEFSTPDEPERTSSEEKPEERKTHSKSTSTSRAERLQSDRTARHRPEHGKTALENENKSKKNVSEIPREHQGPQQETRRPRGVGRFLLSLFLSLIQVALTSVLVIGLIGAASYFVVQKYVGGSEVSVPNLLGSTTDEALEKLKSFGLYLELDRREYSDAHPRGKIVGQFPPWNTSVKVRTPIRVVISDGPARVRVPDLVGMNEIHAGVELRAVPGADLDVGEHSYAFWAGSKKGMVIAQDPPAGTPILRGSRMNLLVSLGPPRLYYEMPDLRHKTIQEARVALGEMRLTISEVREEDRPGVQRGIVVEQKPGPGQRVSQEDAIVLTLASGLGRALP